MATAQNYLIPSSESDVDSLDLDDLIALYPLGSDNLRILAFSVRTILGKVSGIAEAQLSDAVRALLAQGVLIWEEDLSVAANRIVIDDDELWLSTAADDGTGDSPSAGNTNFTSLSGGVDVSVEYAETDSDTDSDWHETQADDDEWWRLDIDGTTTPGIFIGTPADGEHGISVRYVFIRSADEPDTPTGTYTEADGLTLGGGWFESPPDSDDPLYASVATINRNDESVTFSGAFRVEGSIGIDGEDGKSSQFVFNRSESEPSPPTGSYTEADGLTLDGEWQTEPPIVLGGDVETDDGFNLHADHDRAAGIARHDGVSYIGNNALDSNEDDNGIYVYDDQNAYSTLYATHANNDDPTGVAVTPDGTKLFVCDGDGEDVFRYNPSTGAYVSRFSLPSGLYASDIDADNDYIYILNSSAKRVNVFEHDGTAQTAMNREIPHPGVHAYRGLKYHNGRDYVLNSTGSTHQIRVYKNGQHLASETQTLSSANTTGQGLEIDGTQFLVPDRSDSEIYVYGGADETEHPLYASAATIDRNEETVDFSSVFRVEGRIGIDGIDGGPGPQGRFYVILYQNAEEAPGTPPTITYTFETEALANLGDWSATRTTPGAGEDTYTIETIVDPDTEDESVTLSFNTPVNITTAEAVPQQREESVTFQALTTSVTYNTDSDPLLTLATDPVDVGYPGGNVDAELLSVAIAGEAGITVRQKGVYLALWEGVVDIDGVRVVTFMHIYENDATVGTDDPIGMLKGLYHRNIEDNQRLFTIGKLTITADDTVIKCVPRSELPGLSVDSPNYTVDANSKLTLVRLGGTEGEQGPAGGLVAFTAEQVTHTTDDIVLSPHTDIDEYPHGYLAYFRSKRANDGNVSIEVSSLSAITFRKTDGTHFGAGELPANRYVLAVYDSDADRFVALNISPRADADEIYDLVVEILQAGTNITFTENNADNELAINAATSSTATVTEITEANITDPDSDTAGGVSGRRAKAAVEEFAPDADHYHLFATRTLVAGGATDLLNTTNNIIFYQDSGDEWDLLILEHTDLPADYLEHLQLNTDMKMVSGDKVWRGRITNLVDTSDSGAKIRIDFGIEQTGTFAVSDSIVIYFGYAPASISLASDNLTIHGKGTNENKFRLKTENDLVSGDDGKVFVYDHANSRLKPVYLERMSTFYFIGQSERLPIQEDATPSYANVVAGNGIKAFKGVTPDETYNGGIGTVITGNLNDESDADLSPRIDNSFIQIPAGMYHIIMRAVGDQQTDPNALLSFRKITSGFDDVVLIHTPGWTTGSENAAGANLGEYATTHYQDQEKYVTITADDKMYLRLQDFDSSDLVLLGYIQFIRIDI